MSTKKEGNGKIVVHCDPPKYIVESFVNRLILQNEVSPEKQIFLLVGVGVAKIDVWDVDISTNGVKYSGISQFIANESFEHAIFTQRCVDVCLSTIRSFTGLLEKENVKFCLLGMARLYPYENEFDKRDVTPFFFTEEKKKEWHNDCEKITNGPISKGMLESFGIERIDHFFLTAEHIVKEFIATKGIKLMGEIRTEDYSVSGEPYFSILGKYAKTNENFELTVIRQSKDLSSFIPRTLYAETSKKLCGRVPKTIGSDNFLLDTYDVVIHEERVQVFAYSKGNKVDLDNPFSRMRGFFDIKSKNIHDDDELVVYGKISHLQGTGQSAATSERSDPKKMKIKEKGKDLISRENLKREDQKKKKRKKKKNWNELENEKQKIVKDYLIRRMEERKERTKEREELRKEREAKSKEMRKKRREERRKNLVLFFEKEDEKDRMFFEKEKEMEFQFEREESEKEREERNKEFKVLKEYLINYDNEEEDVSSTDSVDSDSSKSSSSSGDNSDSNSKPKFTSKKSDI